MLKTTVAKSTTGYMRWEQDLSLLPSAESLMFTPALDTTADLAIALLVHYSFDLSGYTASELVDRWQKQYPAEWLHLAVIEALYQGRYKAISVQQILTLWQRRGQASFHFNMEFERLICSKFPETLTSVPPPALPPVKKNTINKEPTYPSLPPANPLPNNKKYEEEQRHKTIQNSNQNSKSKIQNSKLLNSDSLPRLNPAAIPNQQPKLLAAAANHPPIGQFTPEKSNASESFTSKLKALSNDKQCSYAQEPNDENSQ